jgi:hypothetical protein
LSAASNVSRERRQSSGFEVNTMRASHLDRVIDNLVGEAEVGNFGGAAFEREIKGRQRGDRLYHKVVKTKR